VEQGIGGGEGSEGGFWYRVVSTMRSQLACGKLWVTCVAGAPSHVAVVAGTGFPSALRRQVNWQRCAVRVGRCKLRQCKGRRVMSGPFAALSANETAEAGLKGDVNGEGAVRGREGLVSSVGTPAYSLAAIQDWYMTDKQLVVISLSAFVVRFANLVMDCWCSFCNGCFSDLAQVLRSLSPCHLGTAGSTCGNCTLVLLCAFLCFISF
jgi:hypothetical protein